MHQESKLKLIKNLQMQTLATSASNLSISKEESTVITGTSLPSKSIVRFLSVWIMQQEKDKQREKLWLLFLEAAPEEAGALEEVELQTERAEYIKDEQVDKGVLDLDRRARQVDNNDWQSKRLDVSEQPQRIQWEAVGNKKTAVIAEGKAVRLLNQEEVASGEEAGVIDKIGKKQDVRFQSADHKAGHQFKAVSPSLKNGGTRKTENAARKTLKPKSITYEIIQMIAQIPTISKTSLSLPHFERLLLNITFL